MHASMPHVQTHGTCEQTHTYIGVATGLRVRAHVRAGVLANVHHTPSHTSGPRVVSFITVHFRGPCRISSLLDEETVSFLVVSTCVSNSSAAGKRWGGHQSREGGRVQSLQVCGGIEQERLNDSSEPDAGGPRKKSHFDAIVAQPQWARPVQFVPAVAT